MNKQKNISLKNYILLALILILSVVAIIYVFKLIGNTKFNSIVLDDYFIAINSNELDNYLVENNDAIIYVYNSNDTKTINFENKLKFAIEKYSINNKIIYLDLGNEINDIKDINKIVGKKVEFPAILLFRNKEIVSIYSIKNNGYNIDKLTIYLKNEGIIND